MEPSRRRFLASSMLCGAGLAATGLMTRLQATPAAALPPVPLPWDVGPGKKYGLDGQAQTWAGNTVISPITATHPAYDVLCRAYEDLRPHAGRSLSWLPSRSLHSTIFDCTADSDRSPGDWPKGLPTDASMATCNRFVADAIRRMPTGIVPPIRMMIDPAPSDELRTVIFLKPIDDREERRVRQLRDALSQATGIRRGNHDHYRFHTSFAYYVRPFTPEGLAGYKQAYAAMLMRLRKAIPVIELPVPEYATFRDMLSYRLQFALKQV